MNYGSLVAFTELEVSAITHQEKKPQMSFETVLTTVESGSLPIPPKEISLYVYPPALPVMSSSDFLLTATVKD